MKHETYYEREMHVLNLTIDHLLPFPVKCVFIYNELWLQSNSLQNDGAIHRIYHKYYHAIWNRTLFLSHDICYVVLLKNNIDLNLDVLVRFMSGYRTD